MLEIVDVREPLTLDDYEAVARLSLAVRDLRREAAQLVPKLGGRKVWMVNSTSTGGGVAEMLPRMVSLLRELGVPTDWAVIGTDRTPFFELTKRLHNMIHGAPGNPLTAADRELYEAVNRDNFVQFAEHVHPGDVVVIHDPQPLPMGRILQEALGVSFIWRCHIGLDERTDVTSNVWRFLRPYAETCDHAVFSAVEYMPDYLAGRTSVIHPALDPLSDKNRDLPTVKQMGILCNGSLAVDHQPVLTSTFEHPAKRLFPDGAWRPANDDGGIGFVYRPVVAQVSRWDHLKGYQSLLAAFVRLKADGEGWPLTPIHRRRLDLVRLVLAGPDPAFVADDPEGQEVLAELSQTYLALPPRLQQDVALVTLPMQSRRENALMVNAIQRCSSLVVQNSVREGFGLTCTEAMWKGVAVVGTQACGLRQQVRDGLDGRLVEDGRDAEMLAATIDTVLEDVELRRRMGRSAQRRVQEEFLVFSQLQKWLRAIVHVVEQRRES